MKNWSIPAAILAALACGGCVDSVRNPTAASTIEVAKGPEAPVQRNITGFDDSLQCMDQLFIDNGVRDIVVLAEDLNDNTKKINIGARDMLISAVSDMTRRSRGIRLIAFGGDVKNLQDWLKNSGANSKVYNFQPDYNIRGSLSQFDEGLVQTDKQLGLTGTVALGTRSSANSAVMGLDLSIISTKTMELLPGVTSKNSVMLIRSSEGTGSGQDGKGGAGFSATIGKLPFGIAYNFNVSRSEGTGGAARNLIELATIELFGKLLRIPYWQCMGIDSQHPVVVREVGDWYYNLLNEGKLVAYMQNQLRIMGRYNGPINGQMNKELSAAITDLVAANNLPKSEVVDEKVFSYVVNLRNKNVKNVQMAKAHLTDAQLKKKYETKTKVPIGVKTAAVKGPVMRSINPNAKAEDGTPAYDPITLTLRNANGLWRPGEKLRVQVASDKDAYVYCYLVAQDLSVMRIFPNPETPDPLVKGGQAAWVPGNGQIALKVGPSKEKESIACMAADVDPAISVGMDHLGNGFERSKLDLEDVRIAIGGGADKAFGETLVEIRKE